ncbi:MAG: alpha-xylosidase [Clostridiales bacterium]|nr:alpha-xylosidase [Clostridiales bacterium]
MRFTDGYWLIRPEFDISYATEVYQVKADDQRLTLLAATRQVRGNKGAVLNMPTLEVELSTPMEGVLCVQVTHFKGALPNKPRFEINRAQLPADITRDGDVWRIRSGALSARIDTKAGWQIDYMADGQSITSSGFRGMAHALNKETNNTYMSDSLMLNVGEWVYGLGEYFTPYIKNGQTVDIWNADGGTQSEQAYKAVPFYMTNRGYGVLVDDAADVSFEIGCEKVERVQFSVPGETLRYYFIYGPHPKEVLRRYTALTGRSALPPAWSFGLWLSTSFTTDYDEDTVNHFIDGMAARDIPLSVFHFDCHWMRGLHWTDFVWDPATFPDPNGMLRRLREKGIRVCVWINPYIAQAGDLFDEGMEKGYFIKKTDGSVWQTDLWQAGMAIVDFTNQAACAWYASHLERLLNQGVDSFKTDFGERIPVRGIQYADGSDPLRMHNYYSFLYNQLVFDTIKKVRGEGEAVLFARSATAGGQRFPAHWGGDCSATYISMAESLRGGLSLAHCGFGFWSHDIGGFEQTAPAHVYKRWAAFGLLSSHSRLHGSSSYRVPWLFDQESVEVLRRFTQLKCRLMPYLYAAAVEAHEQGIPMLRPMVLEFPQDLTVQMLDRQYMLGGSLLVAPVFTQEGWVDYYVPEGSWCNLLTGQIVQGPGWQKEQHGFLTLPLLARPGSVIPLGGNDSRPDYDYLEGLTLHVFALQDGCQTQIKVPDLLGRTAATFTLTRKGEVLTLDSTSPHPVEVVLHQREGVNLTAK